MTDSLRDLTQAANAARTALNSAAYSDASAAVLRSKAQALAAAQLALASANAEAFARIQTSPNELSPGQTASLREAVAVGLEAVAVARTTQRVPLQRFSLSI
jgi:hypothetical protein